MQSGDFFRATHATYSPDKSKDASAPDRSISGRNHLRACLKIPERGCVVLDQPQQASNFRRVEALAACCGWSSTQPRSFFRQALSIHGLRTTR